MRDAEFTQYLFRVGWGPSSKMWPRWARQFEQRISFLTRCGFTLTSSSSSPTVSIKMISFDLSLANLNQSIKTTLTKLIVSLDDNLALVDGVEEGRPSTT